MASSTVWFFCCLTPDCGACFCLFHLLYVMKAGRKVERRVMSEMGMVLVLNLFLYLSHMQLESEKSMGPNVPSD